MKTQLCVAALACFLHSCTSVGPNYLTPSYQFSNSYKAAAEENVTKLQNDQWWDVFGNAELNRLLQKVEQENNNLAVARAQVTKSLAQTNQAKGRSLPTLDFSSSVSRDRSSQNTIIGGFGPAITENYDAGLQLGYEIDFWGKIAREVEASEADAAAAKASLATARLSMKTQLARQFFSLAAVDEELSFLEKSLALRNEQARLIESQREVGAATGIDLSRAKALANTTLADLESLRGTRDVYENAIAVLCGQNPSSFHLASQSLKQSRHEFLLEFRVICLSVARTFLRPNAA